MRTYVAFGVGLAMAAGIAAAFLESTDSAPLSSSKKAAAARERIPEAEGTPETIVVLRDPLSESPRAPTYDPTKLLRTERARAVELFAKEPRDAAWATLMESRIERRLAADLAVMAPHVEVAAIECRTSICEVTVKANEPIGEAGQIALQVLSAADLCSVSGSTEVDGVLTSTYYYAYGEHRDPRDNAEWYGPGRKLILEELRRSGMEALPEE